MINCLILAGGGESALTVKEKVSNKALIKIEEKEMITHVIETVSQFIRRRNIVVVGPTEELQFVKDRLKVRLISENGSIVGNVAAGVKIFGSGRPILVCSSDIPLINKEAVNDFLDRCKPYNHDFYCPIIPKREIEKRFPNSTRTYVKIKEGVFTGGNIFLINPLKINEFSDIGTRILEARKNPLKVASLFGVSFLFRFISGSLTLDQAVRPLERAGIKVKPIITDFFEIGFDIDKPEDLKIVRRYLRKKGGES